MKYKDGDFVYIWSINQVVKVQIERSSVSAYDTIQGDYLVYSSDPYVYSYCHHDQVFDSKQECFNKSFPIFCSNIDREIKNLQRQIENYKTMLKSTMESDEYKSYNRSVRINELTETN